MCARPKNLKKKAMWTPFLRQLLICSGVLATHFTYGMCIGSPTVFIPQIRKENNSTEAVSDEMASWLSSVIGFSGFPFVFGLAFLIKFIGRKKCFIIAGVDSLIGFIVFYCSNSVYGILISEMIQGLFSAAQIVVSVVVLTEYTSPKYRGLFLTLKSATFYWGIWVSNAIGTFLHWKNIGLLGIACGLYNLLTVLMWPESPYWLASKGRFRECAASHRWLKGCDDESEKELEVLINVQKQYNIKNAEKLPLFTKKTFKDVYATVTSREFYKPVLVSLATGLLIIFSGKLIYTVYAIDILKKITKSESTAYIGMLILDGITVFSMYVGCFVSKFSKRRPWLLISSSLAVLFLFTLSLYLYLIRLSVINENKYVSLGLLIMLTIVVACGPMILSSSIFGELLPVRSRNLAVCFSGVLSKVLVAMSLKVAPYLFKSLGLHGVFLFFGISCIVLLILLYIYLPETKDKTLQEISDSIMGVKKSIVTAEEEAKLVKLRNTTV